MGQKLPENWEEVTNFHQFVSRQKEELAIQADRVFNMDEVPMSFDAPYSRTVDTTGAESIPVSTTGHEKTGFSVVLVCSESGEKAEANGHLEEKNNAERKPPQWCGCPLPQQRMDG